MKRLLPKILLALAILSVPLTPALTCKQTQQRAVYNTLYSTGLSVHDAYSGYLDSVLQGLTHTNSVPQVSKAYNDFQSGFAVAVAAATFTGGTNAITPANVQDLANSVIALITQVKGH